MAIEEAVRQVTRIAGSAVTIYRFITLASDGEVDHVAAAGAMPDGVAMEGASAQGKSLAMALPDGATVKVEAGGTFAKGDYVESNGSGQAIAFPGTVGHISCGKALEAGASGQIVAIQFFNAKSNVGT